VSRTRWLGPPKGAFMGIFSGQVLQRVSPALLVAVVAAGCVSEKTVYKERQLYTTPPAQAANFLGYTDTTTKLTVCGNCHVGVQATWIKTKHANAWADLQASGHATASCYPCHTVNSNGNATTGDAGYTAVADARYQDVQCESCHGPGLQHVENPDSTQPIASLAIDTDSTTRTNGCAECHNGVHNPFVEQWSLSKHAGFISQHAATNAACVECHTGQGALAAWGVTGPYLEQNSSAPLPIVCGVCHDPHGSPNAHQLRFPINTTSITTHLCARCHNYETSPNGASPYGLHPMAPESQLLTGTAGYFPPNFDISAADSIIGTHGSSANPTLCATCHLASFQVTDPLTGAFKFQAVGHTFNALPCLDANGEPSGELDCPITTTARSWAGCTASGCHGTPDAARSVLITRLTTVSTLSDTLIAMLTRLDPNLDGAGGAIDPNDGVLTVAEGAFFNYNLANWTAQVNSTTFTNKDVALLGSTVHNPFLLTALLEGSIQAVAAAYPGVASSVSPAYLESLRVDMVQIKAKGMVHPASAGDR
jgi:predicted CXXCH cytochrome family protein